MAGTALRTQDGRLVGVLKGNVLHKSVQMSKHLFRAIGARGSFGIDYDVLFEELPERSSIYITDTESKSVYMTPAARWRENGEIKHFKEGSKDHYTQVFLPLEYFDKTKQNGI